MSIPLIPLLAFALIFSALGGYCILVCALTGDRAGAWRNAACFAGIVLLFALAIAGA